MNEQDRLRRRLARHERKRQRLGAPVPTCGACGCASVEALLSVPFSDLAPAMQRRVIERHHPAGRRGDPWMVPFCLNCHAIVSDRQQDWEERLQHPVTKRERLAATLKGAADWLRQFGQSAIEGADRLNALSAEILGTEDETP